MECLIFFGMTSMKEGTSAQLSGRGELHGGARVTTLVTLRKCTLGYKREIKTLKFVSALTKGFKGGLRLDQALQERHGSDFFLLHVLQVFCWEKGEQRHALDRRVLIVIGRDEQHVHLGHG